MTAQASSCTLLLINGRMIDLDIPRYLNLVFSKRIILSMVMTTWFLSAADIHNQSNDFNLLARVGLWFHVLFFLYLVQFAGFVTFVLLGRRVAPLMGLSKLILPGVLLSLVTVVSTTIFGFFLNDMYGLADTSIGKFWREVLFNWLVSVFIEYLLAQFLLKNTVELKESPKTKSIFPQRREISLADQLFDIDKILYLAAEGRSTHVYLADGTNHSLPQYFSEMCHRFPPAEGIQIHRSFWVRFDAISEVSLREGRHFCLLTNGTSLAIARNRVQGIKDALIIRNKATPNSVR